MIEEEKMRERILKELEDSDWDMSDEGLDRIAEKIQTHFRNSDDARDFVDSQASYLYDRIDEYYS
jgi:hypothetical protein